MDETVCNRFEHPHAWPTNRRPHITVRLQCLVVKFPVTLFLRGGMIQRGEKPPPCVFFTPRGSPGNRAETPTFMGVKIF